MLIISVQRFQNSFIFELFPFPLVILDKSLDILLLASANLMRCPHFLNRIKNPVLAYFALNLNHFRIGSLRASLYELQNGGVSFPSRLLWGKLGGIGFYWFALEQERFVLGERTGLVAALSLRFHILL